MTATETVSDSPTASANGTAPADTAPPTGDNSERIMGALAILAALGLLFIGLDLIWGVSERVFPPRGEAEG